MTARAADDIYIVEDVDPEPGAPDDDLRVGTLFSRTEGVYLTATGGSIVDGLNHDFTNIQANLIVLNASGGIGENGDYLEVDVAFPLLPGDVVDVVGNGTLTATAGGDIFIEETFGSMNIRNILSTGGDVDLQAALFILDAVDLTDPLNPDSAHAAANPATTQIQADIIGNNIKLEAGIGGPGGIGRLGNDLDIDSAYSLAGELSATSNSENIYIIPRAAGGGNDDVTLGRIDAGGEVAFITAPSGQILSSADTAADVVSGKLWLFARDDIGKSGNSISTVADNIEARSTTRNVFIDNSGAVVSGDVVSGHNGQTASGINAGGNVVFEASSPITVAENILAGGAITLHAHDDADAEPDDLTVNAGITIQAGTSITLLAGDNLLLLPAVQLIAGTSIFLQADFGNAEGATDSIVLTAAILSAGTTITGTATGQVNILAATTATAGTDVSLTAGESLTVSGSDLTATSGSATLDAQGGDLTINGGSTVTAGGSFSGDASANITVDGVSMITTGTSASFTSGLSLTVTGGSTVNAGTTLTANAGTNITITGASIVSANLAASFSSGLALTVTASSSVSGLTVTGNALINVLVSASATITGTTGVTLTALNNLDVNTLASIAAPAGSVSLEATTGAIHIWTSAMVTAGIAVTGVAEQSVTVDQSARITAGTNVSLTSNTGNVTIDTLARIEAQTGFVSMAALLNSVRVSGVADITAKTDVLIAAQIGVVVDDSRITATDGNVDIDATTGNITIRNSSMVTAGNDVDGDAGTDITIQTGSDITAENDVRLTVNRDVRIDDAMVTATVHDIVVEATTGDLTVAAAATLTAGNSVSGTADQNVTVDASTIRAIADAVTLVATMGALRITNTSTIIAGGSISGTAGTDVTVEDDNDPVADVPTNVADNSLLTAGVNISLTGGDNVTIDDSTLTAGNNATFDANGGDLSMINAAVVTAGNSVTGTASANITVQDGDEADDNDTRMPPNTEDNSVVTATAGNLSLTAEGGFILIDDSNLSAAAEVSALVGNVTLIAQGGDLTVTNASTIDAGTSVTGTASANIKIQDGFFDDNDTAAAQNTDDNSVVTAATGDVTLTAEDGSIVIDDSNVAATLGNVVMSAIRVTNVADLTVTNAATVFAGTSVTGTASDDITIQEDFEIDPSADVPTNVADNSLVTAGVDISLTAGANVTIDDSTLMAGNNATFDADGGDLSMINAAVVTAGNSVTGTASANITVQDGDEADDNDTRVPPNTEDNSVVTADTGDVTLTAEDGSILIDDSNLEATLGSVFMTAVNVSNIADLTVTNASTIIAGTSIIGDASDDVTIQGGTLNDVEAVPGDPDDNSSVFAEVDVTLTAGANVTIDDSDVTANSGSVDIDANTAALTVKNNATVTGHIDVTGDAGTNVTVEHRSTVEARTRNIHLTAFDNLLVDTESLIKALGDGFVPDTVDGAPDIFLFAGDDLHLTPTSTVLATDLIEIRGDIHDTGAVGVAGTLIVLEGILDGERIDVFGEHDFDRIELRPVDVAGHMQIFGQEGEDLIIVDHMTTLTTTHNRPFDLFDRPILDTVDIDGGAAADDVVINITAGTSDYPSKVPTEYIINVKDSGHPADGADTLTINGTDINDPNHASGHDIFLLREHFVAYLTPIVALTEPGQVPGALFNAVERINYDESINGRLRINAGSGHDQFYMDDNSAITTLDGGEGEDLFQIGQVFGTNPNGTIDDPRVVADDVDDIDRTSDSDDIDLTQITRGWLSRGVTYAMTIFGGEDGDTFSVYSNKAVLRMEGESGNDTFIIRAFIAEDDIIAEGGSGDDTFEYNINAPVSINGGTGFDTVVAIGTEREDAFVITEDGIFGAGLNI